MSVHWLPEELEAARRIAARHTDAIAAAAEVSHVIGRQVSWSGITFALSRHGLGSATRLLASTKTASVPAAVAPSAASSPVLSPAPAPPPSLAALVGRHTIAETCDALDVAPKRLREMIDEAAKAGVRARLEGDVLVVDAPEPAPAPRAKVELPREPSTMLEERASAVRERKLKAERDSLLDQLQEERARAVYVDALRAPTVPVVARREPISGMREGALIVLASDWHVEEPVDPVSIGGVNRYDLDVAEARAHRFFDGISWLLNFERQAFTLRDLVLWLGGDFYSGYIHAELVESAACSPVESILVVKRLLTQGIRHLLQDPLLERIVVPCSYGNHGRTTEKRRVATGAKNSFEWLLYQVMSQEFASEPRVTFTADQSAHQYVDVFDKTLHFTHGDETRFLGGVGGLSIPLNKRIPQWDRVKPSAIHHLGHYHQFLDLGRAVVNGSLIGFNSYAQSIGASPEPPQQAAYVLDAKRGKALVTPLWVGEDSLAEASS